MRDSLYVDAVRKKFAALRRSRLWAPESTLRVSAWLDSFPDDEQAVAAFLLEQFTFISEAATTALLVAAFDRLRGGLGGHGGSAPPPPDTFFAPVQGEDPNPADSGYQFARALREHAGVPQSKICSPEQAGSGGVASVVFVDDFCASGEQFLKMWRDLPTRPSTAFYLCLCSTSYAAQRLASAAPEVTLAPAHILDDQYHIDNLIASQTNPPIVDVAARVRSLIEKHAATLELPDSSKYMNTNPDWLRYGFHSLGLAVAFEHSIPDCSLPVFWSGSTKEGFTPLKRRQ